VESLTTHQRHLLYGRRTARKTREPGRPPSQDSERGTRAPPIHGGCHQARAPLGGPAHSRAPAATTGGKAGNRPPIKSAQHLARAASSHVRRGLELPGTSGNNGPRLG
jgi:hypothetical protein